MGKCKAGDDFERRTRAARDDQEPEKKQQMIIAGQDVIDPHFEKAGRRGLNRWLRGFTNPRQRNRCCIRGDAEQTLGDCLGLSAVDRKILSVTGREAIEESGPHSKVGWISRRQCQANYSVVLGVDAMIRTGWEDDFAIESDLEFPGDKL